MKIQLLTDNYFITERLKEIDDSYFVLYNTKIKRYELHSSTQLFTTYCLTFPFDALDERALDHARKSRCENREKLIKEMEMENDKLMRKIQKDNQEKAIAYLE